MAYLHENKVEFSIALNLASERFGFLPIVAEKDYYIQELARLRNEKERRNENDTEQHD